MVPRGEKMIFRLMDKDFNDCVGEVRLPNERSINCTESTHNTLIQQRHSLPRSKLGHETLNDTK